ncbi:flagellar export chaperone FlgN [Immundisolibacter sp.]|uniref:flagellar export chaperone FlgN n=1 Tax=Immundisolibacter sp. TaxID=1934948 RepID=UPI002623D1D1|nr:flagellar export chaperone FlgN [Immundisolibacter sp.]MDD3650840.1 flagellar export chaperone FlgN [Immundisolibacter sp.]
MTADPQPLLDALAALLEQEYAALRRADAAAVTDIAARKRELTDHLAGLHLPDAGELPPALGALAQRCRDLNRRNGELLHLQQGMLTRAMRVLSGADPAPTVYGARGQTLGDAGGRHIGSA